MWYVVQVIGGQEDAAVLKIQKQASNETFKTVFVPKYEIRKRFRGLENPKGSPFPRVRIRRYQNTRFISPRTEQGNNYDKTPFRRNRNRQKEVHPTF